jgi:hypothetical protein
MEKLKNILIYILAFIWAFLLICMIVEPYYIKELYTYLSIRITASDITQFDNIKLDNSSWSEYIVNKWTNRFFIKNNNPTIYVNNSWLSWEIEIYAYSSKFNSIISPLPELPIWRLFFKNSDNNFCIVIKPIVIGWISREPDYNLWDEKEKWCIIVTQSNLPINKYYDWFFVAFISSWSWVINVTLN